MSFVRIIAATVIIAVAAFVINRLRSMTPEPPKIERISIKTVDGVNLSAVYYSLDKPRGAVVFAHMMPATKDSWDSLSKAFLDKDYSSVAIDLRGHGESDGGPKSYSKFEDADHQKSILDLDAAARFLMSKGFTQEQIIFIGASIGANLSLKYIADHPEYKTAILLSAGANYRGILAEPAARVLSKGQRVFIISSKDDGENTVESESIFNNLSDEAYKEIKVYDRGGHGTDLLGSHSNLQDVIIDFVLRGNFNA